MQLDFEMPEISWEIHGKDYSILKSFSDQMPQDIPHSLVKVIWFPCNAPFPFLDEMYNYAYDKLKKDDLQRATSAKLLENLNTKQG